MKLFYSPIHLFAHKVLIVAFESEVIDNIEFVPVYPLREGYNITALNPLNKVPTLTLDNGEVIYGSQAIVEYIDSLSLNKSLYPVNGPSRWDALRRLALADTLFEITTQLTTDDNYGDGPREKFVSWLWPKVTRCVDAMNADINESREFDIGDAAQLHALTYLQLCIPDHVPDLIPKDYDWRENHENLSKWFDKTVLRPSVAFHYNKPYEGDDSPENCQLNVNEVLKLQNRKG